MNSFGTWPLTQTFGWRTRGRSGRCGPSDTAPRKPRLFHSNHFVFLPSDQWPRAALLCHSLLIHSSSSARLTVAMARSISTAQETAAERLSTPIFITLRLDPLPEALLLPDHNTTAPGAAKAPFVCSHQSTTPRTSVHLLHPRPARRQARIDGLPSLPLLPAVTLAGCDPANSHVDAGGRRRRLVWGRACAQRAQRRSLSAAGNVGPVRDICRPAHSFPVAEASGRSRMVVVRWRARDGWAALRPLSLVHAPRREGVLPLCAPGGGACHPMPAGRLRRACFPEPAERPFYPTRFPRAHRAPFVTSHCTVREKTPEILNPATSGAYASAG